MADIPREQLPKSQLGKDYVADGPELMVPGVTSWNPSRPKQTPLHVWKKLKETCVGGVTFRSRVWTGEDGCPGLQELMEVL